MAEPEELVWDAARHATVFVQGLWQKRRANRQPSVIELTDVTRRLNLFIQAVFSRSYPLRPAQSPAHPTLLGTLFHYDRTPRQREPAPSTDGASIWLPPRMDPTNAADALDLYRVMALQQAIRLQRGSASALQELPSSPVERDVYLLLEAWAADYALLEQLPGMAGGLAQLRRHALAKRPPLDAVPPARQPLEGLVQCLLGSPLGAQRTPLPVTASPQESVEAVPDIIRALALLPPDTKPRLLGPNPLLKDWWTGQLFGSAAACADRALKGKDDPLDDDRADAVRSTRLARRPQVREAAEGEDDNEQEPGAWMVQGDESHQHAEDPMGLQRPTDRDDKTTADEFGDLVSEIPEARLVSTPGKPREVLLSDDPPDGRVRQPSNKSLKEAPGIRYPEWDYRSQSYLEAGTTVRLLSAQDGSQQWLTETLDHHRSLLHAIRRRFEMLRARRVWHRRQLDGDEVDLDAYVNSFADVRAGGAAAEGLYRSRQNTDRDLAITLLIDISGSTDSWVSSNRRIIDIEREALLLVCIALQGLGEPFSIQAFSGEGPQAVIVRQVKHFNEPYSEAVGLRISGLEPEDYTRAGAAIRHATADLMQQPAAHRLLLLLSDGKPNDKDDYEGRYGIEDMRQAVREATLQHISPFCLTIDRQASSYLPRIFGTHHYALLPQPDRLPLVLLDWMKRLVMS